MIVFLILFGCTDIVTHNFNNLPFNVGFIITGIVAVIMSFNIVIETEIDNYCKGESYPNILLMCFIFIFAVAFCQHPDTIACAVQGMIPFCRQQLVAANLASISTIKIVKYNMYCYLMFIIVFLILLIASNFAIFKREQNNARSLNPQEATK